MEYAYLLVVKGQPLGAHYPLEPTETVRIGRGPECQITLTDPLCSRVHAELRHQEDGWWVTDLESRNGTYLNGDSIQHAFLPRGGQLRIGSTEFTVQFSEQPLTDELEEATKATSPAGRDSWIDAEHPELAIVAGFENADYVHELLVLYQLGLRLLGTADPGPVIDQTLDILAERNRGAHVGFFWRSDVGHMKLQESRCVGASSESDDQMWTDIVPLIERAARERRALWYHGDHPARDFAGAASKEAEGVVGLVGKIIVPLLHQGQVHGSVALVRPAKSFAEVDLEFSKSATVLLCAALMRARAQASLWAEHQRLVDSAASTDELIGDSQPMRTLKTKIFRVAPTARIVLIRGESGSGKELVARALHRAGPRSDRPLLSVNCAAIPADLVESQLFGHVQGAFTSADRDYPGWFQQADTGTLFLDEIGELPLSGQAKLLRVLDGHAFHPVGGQLPVQVDVRVICATNRSLQEMVRSGEFRSDLYYRISAIELELPPLRDRGADLELLIDYFLDHFRRLHGRPQLMLSKPARRLLIDYPWPGNVRQLRNVIDTAVIMAEREMIEPTELALPTAERVLGSTASLRIDEWEKHLISQALERTGGRVPEAAELLGIGRATLYRKIDEYQILR